MKVMTWNVRGSRGKEEQITGILKTHYPEVMVITETMTEDPTLWNNHGVGYKEFNIPATRTENTNVPRGGIAVLVKGTICAFPRYIVNEKGSDSKAILQGLTIQIGKNTWITGAYLSPKCNKGEILNFVKEHRSRAPAGLIIIGDMNARHTTWDKRSNAAGRILVKATTNTPLKIYAPQSPTFRSQAGTSVIDIAISNLSMHDQPKVCTGAWEGASDHEPVRFYPNIEWTPDDRPRRISKTAMANKQNIQKAVTYYRQHIPEAIRTLEQAQGEEVQRAFTTATETITGPWQATARQRPKRYKPFWNRNLDAQARERQKAYRTAKKREERNTGTDSNASGR